MKRFRYGEKGFTLLEMLVVVAILGALTAVVIPNVVKFMNEGKEEARLAEHHNLQTSVLAILVDADVRFLDGDDYPRTIQEKADVQGVTAGSGAHSLDEYIIGGQWPLLQAYYITKIGAVSVHPE